MALDKSVNKNRHDDNMQGKKKDINFWIPKNIGRLLLSIKCKLSHKNYCYMCNPCVLKLKEILIL